MSAYDEVVIVTKKSDFEQLTTKTGSYNNAVMYMSARGDSIERYEKSAAISASNVKKIKTKIPENSLKLKWREIEVEEAAMFPWGPNQIVLLTGPDGLFVNVAKHLLLNQPVICVNPDPESISGVIMRHTPDNIVKLLENLISGSAAIKQVTLGKVTTNEPGSSESNTLFAVNDFLVGRNDQRSARYIIKYSGEEHQISSGVLVSAPMGGSGWLSSCTGQNPFLDVWDADRLHFYVREPFRSVNSGDRHRQGFIDRQHTLKIQSEMHEGGVIFSDGMTNESLNFAAGVEATFGVADHRVHYVVG